eukprot:g17097.t1
MGNKHSKSRRKSRVTVDNQKQKPQDVPPTASPDDERPTKSTIIGEGNKERHEEELQLKPSTKTTEAPVGPTIKNSEQRQSNDVTAGSSVSKGPPGKAGRAPTPEEQPERNLVVHETTCGGSNAGGLVAGAVSGNNTRSSSGGPINHNVPLLASANATNGYISFSESESDVSASSPAAVITAATLHGSSEVDVPRDYGHEKLAVGGGQEQAQQDRSAEDVGAKSDDGSGDDMWDFGDEDSDEEQALGRRVAATTVSGQHQQGQHQLINGSRGSDRLVVVPLSLAAGIGGGGTAGAGSGGNGGFVDEPPQARVVVDRLGRRENAPRRASSSSSSDDFDGWGDDDDDEEEEEGDGETDEDGDGSVYDWTVMDTGEGGTDGVFGAPGSGPRARAGARARARRSTRRESGDAGEGRTAAVLPTDAGPTSTPTSTSTSIYLRNNTSGRGSGVGGAGELARSMSGIAANGKENLGAPPAAAVGGAGARPVTAAAGDATVASARAAGGASRPASSIPTTGGARGLVVGGGGTAAAGSTGSEEAVKDTANITRKKAQLPQQEQLEHPTPVGGSWLKNRYIVNNYILLEPLGTGSYAEVRLAKEKTSNKLYAVKIMNKDFLKKRQVGKEETFMDSIKREIAIMKKVHHPNVLRLFEVMDDPKVNKLYLVLEYCKKGDLMNILNGDTRTVTCDPMNDTDVWYIMRQIVQGLSFLHLQNIVHGDIKPQNLLVGSDNVAKIADFGISKFVQGSHQRLQEQAGTPTFMSPELCCGEGYSGQLADVWALGATMYMIRCGKPPFMANQVMALYDKIQNDPLEFPPEVNMSVGLKRLLRAMMEKGAAQRVTLDQVVADRWLQQGDYGYAHTTTAGGPPSSARMPSSGTVPTGRGGGVNAPHGVSGAIGGFGGEHGNGGSGGPPPCGSPSPGAAGGGGLGLRPPPSLSFLPLTQQGYRAIKVSDDEVHKSINQGTTTGGCAGSSSGCGSAAGRGGRSLPAQQRAAANPTTPSILEEAATAASPGVAAATTAATQGASPSPPLVGGVGACIGEEAGKRDSDGSRGHLSETEESWKYRSFKKKMEGNGADPKYRGGTMSGGDVRQPPTTVIDAPAITVAGRPPHVITDYAYNSPTTPGVPASATASALLHRKKPAAHHEQTMQQQQQQQSRGQGDRDTTPASSDFFGDDDSDDDGFSSEDPDTLYERECSGATATIASSPSASASSASPSPSSAQARHAPAAPRREPGGSSSQHKTGGSGRGGVAEGGDSTGFGGGRGGGRGGGAGGEAVQRHPARSAAGKRPSSARFDAVMDTLSAQPPVRGGRGNTGGSAGGATRHNVPDGRPPAHSVCRPLRDLDLRGVRVTSRASSAGATTKGLSGESSGNNCYNGRLGLVAAASQRQGKRPSQEDRTTVAADLAVALTGKVERAHLYHQFGLFAIFDGHNGQMSADALQAGLHVAVGKQPTFHQALDKALVQAFNSFDKDLCVRQAQEGDASGSTGLVVLFDGRSRGLIVANVGDSRCVASRAGVAARLSSDHRLSRADERERVAARGGFVANNRINGVLAVSRSFGDAQHKDGSSPALIATPELRSESVACSYSAGSPSGAEGGGVGGGDGSGGVLEFVILASDGLWDVVEDQEAVNFVRLRLAENDGNLSVAATELTKLALDQGSVDNSGLELEAIERQHFREASN